MSIKNVMKAYDKIAQSYGGYRRAEWKLVTDFKKGRGKVLDIGCGNQLRGDYGLDISIEMLKKSKKIGKVIQGSADKLPLKTSSFEKVMMLAVLHHVPKSSRKKVIAEISRVLKPNGKALITVWAKEHRRFMKEVIVGDKAKVKWGEVDRYYYLFSLDELKKTAQRYGMKILEADKAGDNYYVILRKRPEATRWHHLKAASLD